MTRSPDGGPARSGVERQLGRELETLQREVHELWKYAEHEAEGSRESFVGLSVDPEGEQGQGQILANQFEYRHYLRAREMMRARTKKD